MSPEFRPLWRQQGLSNLDDPFDELFRLRSECEIDSFGSPEEVGNDWEWTSLHSFEKERRAAFVDHAPMDLGQLEVGIDFSFNCGEIIFAPQEIEEGAKVTMH